MKRKILSLLTAFAMVFGILVSPFTASAADVVESGLDPAAAKAQKTDVVIHKIEMKSLDKAQWPKKAGVESNGIKYDGTELDLKYFANDAAELDDVVFYMYKVNSKESYEKLKANPENYRTKELMDQKIAASGEDKIDATLDPREIKTAGGKGATVSGLDNGYYWFVEDQDSVSRNGRTFSDAAAVPFGLSLPYARKDGKPFTTVADKNALHVYPKNTLANEPKVDKDFKKPGANVDNPRSEDEKNNPESHNVGDLIDYQVKTEFQAGTKYETAFWTDQMTEGLEFQDNSVVVKIGEDTLTKGTDYKLETTVNTFKLSLLAPGLAKVNNQANATTVTIEYKAKLTNKAKVEIPESNDVVFHYGNNPSKGNTPVPNKPKNKKMKVKKSWIKKDDSEMKGNEIPTDKNVTLQLYDANTGEKVGNSITLPQNGNWEYEWTDLDDNKSYKVKEEGIDGYDAEYGIENTESEAVITIKNHKTDNPAPKNPNEPKVVTYGKKFVKMEENGTNRLKGAKFVIKNNIEGDTNKDKFLKKVNGADKSAFDTAQKAYEAAVEAYNKAVEANNVTEDLKTKLTTTRATRDAEWNAYLSSLTEWTDKKAEALELESGEDGSFEIHGLKEGSYKLVETQKPAGYAARTDEIEFTVGKGTYEAHADGVNFKPEETDKKDAQRVDNKKVTIPETGGIGSLVFIAAGLAIMTIAFVAYKKSEARA